MEDTTKPEVNLLDSLFGSDTNMEVTGKWVYPAGESEGAPAFKLARAGGANKKFDAVMTAKLKPNQRYIQAHVKEMDPETRRMITEATREAFLQTCILDWKNVRTKERGNIPFSKEAANELFNQYPSLYDELLGTAQSLFTFQSADVEGELGNS